MNWSSFWRVSFWPENRPDRGTSDTPILTFDSHPGVFHRSNLKRVRLFGPNSLDEPKAGGMWSLELFSLTRFPISIQPDYSHLCSLDEVTPLDPVREFLTRWDRFTKGQRDSGPSYHGENDQNAILT